ncbi:SMP-30/gluconolactonase/LRE family protein [Polaromonas sp. P2-4]|nr:SMP-30/gluconolactonase/LRE family protein [Polaromonas sp. P2-4]
MVFDQHGGISNVPFPSPFGGRLICGMPGFQRFDSLAVEAAGNICVATLVAGCIAFVSPDGAVLGHVQMPGDEPRSRGAEA